MHVDAKSSRLFCISREVDPAKRADDSIEIPRGERFKRELRGLDVHDFPITRMEAGISIDASADIASNDAS